MRPWCGPYTVVTSLDDIMFQIRRSANSRPMVVHYNRIKPYVGNRYQPEEFPEERTHGRAIRHPLMSSTLTLTTTTTKTLSKTRGRLLC